MNVKGTYEGCLNKDDFTRATNIRTKMAKWHFSFPVISIVNTICTIVVCLLSFSCTPQSNSPVISDNTATAHAKDSSEISVMLDSASLNFQKASYKKSLSFAKAASQLAYEKKDTGMWMEGLSYQMGAYQRMAVLDSAINICYQMALLDSLQGDFTYLSIDYNNLAGICLWQNGTSLLNKISTAP